MADLNLRYVKVADFCRMLEKREPFLFSRYGDGEWSAILGRRRPGETNCDGHHYFPNLTFELQQALLSRPGYMVGMQEFALKLYKGIRPWLERHKLLDLDWVVADTFHRASSWGGLRPLADALRKRTLILVGPEHLRPVGVALQAVEFVPVPRKDCYLKLPEIIRETWNAVDRQRGKEPVISVSCGMPAKILIHKLQVEEGVTVLDMGSVWDVYAGVRSRKYHKQMKPKPL